MVNVYLWLNSTYHPSTESVFDRGEKNIRVNSISQVDVMFSGGPCMEFGHRDTVTMS